MERIPRTHEDFEALIREIQAKRREIPATAPAPKETDAGVSTASGSFGREIYESAKGKYEGYLTSIAVDDDVDEEDEDVRYLKKQTGYGAPVAFLDDVARTGRDFDPFADRRRPTVAQREDEYQQKWRRRVLSPDRIDPFAEDLAGNKRTVQMSTHQGRRTKDNPKQDKASRKERKEMYRKLARREEKLKMEKEGKRGQNQKIAKKTEGSVVHKKKNTSDQVHGHRKTTSGRKRGHLMKNDFNQTT